MNVFVEGALLLIAGMVFFLLWLGLTRGNGELLPPGWYVAPCALIGMLLITGALV
ncbi:MAG: hypothetical protein Q4G26_14730 [Paracoccus sp. (in: a-proteobacteria)]|nr:hypothetical protein [Paracoccus sp. (in: a-proteobacteria)]